VNDTFTVGDFVCVDADRGYDLGVVVEIQQISNRESNGIVNASYISGLNRILRRATNYEIENLPDKYASEQVVEQVRFLQLLKFLVFLWWLTQYVVPADVYRALRKSVSFAHSNCWLRISV
jgi:hypothetical protein